MFEIEWSATPYKELKKLPVFVQRIIIKKLDVAAIKPEHYFTKLVGCDLLKLRIGKYRALVRVEQDRMIILVMEIGHRKNVYD